MASGSAKYLKWSGLYREMGRAFKSLIHGRLHTTSHPRFEALFGRKADKRRKLYNGRIW